MHPFEEKINDIADFPKKGVVFKDIFPLLKDHLPEVVIQMGKDIDWDKVDYIAGIESRGFILGSAMASHYQKGFIPIRKKGKLPPPVVSEEYALEYGTDTLEMQPNLETKNIVIVDDVLATGGTLKATIKLCKKANYNIIDLAVLIDLKFLNTFDKEGIKVKSVLSYS